LQNKIIEFKSLSPTLFEGGIHPLIVYGWDRSELLWCSEEEMHDHGNEMKDIITKNVKE